MPASGTLYDPVFGWASSTAGNMGYGSPGGAARAAQGAAPGGMAPQAAEAAAGIKRNTEGRADELANDPRMTGALDFFGKVMGGAEGPYTEQSKGAMLTQHANASSAAQAAQMRALQDAAAASGGSMADPSFQAKAQELNAMRQGSNMDAQSGIEADAAQANFGAKMSGASNLAATRGAQNAQINQMRSLAAEHQGRVQVAVPSAGNNGAPQPVQTGGIRSFR